MPILHVLIIRDIDSVHRAVIGPFDGAKPARDFVNDNRAKFEEKYGDQITFRIEPLTPPSYAFEE